MLFHTGQIWQRQGYNGCQSDLDSDFVYCEQFRLVSYKLNGIRSGTESDLATVSIVILLPVLTSILHQYSGSTWCLYFEILNIVHFTVNHDPHSAVFIVILQISLSDQCHFVHRFLLVVVRFHYKRDKNIKFEVVHGSIRKWRITAYPYRTILTEQHFRTFPEFHSGNQSENTMSPFVPGFVSFFQAFN